MIKNKLKHLFYQLNARWQRQEVINSLLLGKLHVERIKSKAIVDDLAEVEFQVFSQFGEDGIIQYLINLIEIPNKVFIEFGVEYYFESNTRFLLLNDRWSGLVIDSSRSAINFIKKDNLAYNRTNITALESFITKDNINSLIGKYTNISDIGLLSVDIDGNDYWVFEAINVVRPRIVICEYNGFFGADVKVSVPYKEDFVREKEHYSHIYFGASLSALVDLANRKGYDFIGCTSQGLNAFFIRSDTNHSIEKLTAKQGFVPPKHKELRTREKTITDTPWEEVIKAINGLPIHDFEKNAVIPFNCEVRL